LTQQCSHLPFCVTPELIIISDKYKNFPQPPAGRLMPIGTPVEPWKAILVDFIVGLPEAQGHDALLMVVD